MRSHEDTLDHGATARQVPSDRAAGHRDWQLVRRLGLAVLVISCTVPLAMNVADADLWGHVLYGQEAIEQGVLPRTATHTSTAVGPPWVNHEVFAEYLLARGFSLLGTSGMLTAKVTLGMAMLLLMASAARRSGARPLVTWAVLLAVAYTLHAFFPLRPQLLSFFFCSVLLWLLDRAFAGWRSRRTDFLHHRRRSDPKPIDWRPLLFLPLLMAVWANSHGGFVAGLGLLGGVLAGRGIELLYRLRGAARPAVLGLAAVFFVSTAATLFNPYGFALHAWLYESLSIGRPEISEWGPPSWQNPGFAPFVVLAGLAVVSLIATERRRDPTQILLLAVVAGLACVQMRHIAFFALLCGFWLPPHTQSAARRLRRFLNRSDAVPTLTPSWRRVAVVAFALAIACQANLLGQRIAKLPVYRSDYPVDALQWMADHNASGNLIVSYNWAQYAMAALAPDLRVAFDGRFRTCYPQPVIDRHFDFLLSDKAPRLRSPSSGPIDAERTLREDRPDYVLLDRRYPKPVRVLQNEAALPDSDWLLVYQDAIAQVWALRSVVDAPGSTRQIPADRRFVSDHYSTTAVDWPALPRRARLSTESTNEVAARRVDAPLDEAG